MGQIAELLYDDTMITDTQAAAAARLIHEHWQSGHRLAALPDALIHAPWEAPPILRPRIYPAPIIDLATGRNRALEAYAALPKTGGETQPPAP